MDAIFYIDESGNTGTDWINEEQPYFVYGGWLIINNNKIEVEKYLNSILSKQQGVELKSRHLFKKKDGIKIFSEFLNTMIEKFKCIPFWAVVEKKFMVAAKIVETFFDYEYNPAINTFLTQPVELKRALASCIYTNDNIIELFSPLIKNCSLSLEKMKKIKDELIKHFNNQGHKMVAESLMGLKEENLLEMVDEFKCVTYEGTRKNRITLTGTILIELLKNVQLFSSIIDCNVTVYHDKLRGYDKYFKKLGDIFFKEGTPILSGTTERISLSNFPDIKALEMFDSKEQINIQAADLLCGFISNTFKSIMRGITLDSETMQILYKLMCMQDQLIDYNVMVCNLYASYQFEKEFFLEFKNDYKCNDYNKIIKGDFYKAIR